MVQVFCPRSFAGALACLRPFCLLLCFCASVVGCTGNESGANSPPGPFVSSGKLTGESLLSATDTKTQFQNGEEHVIHSFDLGERVSGLAATFQLQIVNPTALTWNVTSVETGCSCARVSLSDSTVGAGDMVVATVDINFPDDPGVFSTKFSLSDGDVTYCTSNVAAKTYRPLEAVPPVIDFGTFYAPGQRSASIVCSVNPKEEPAATLFVAPANETISVSVAEVAAGRSWSVNALLTLEDVSQARVVKGNLSIDVGDKEGGAENRQLVIPYKYEISTGMRCSPSALFLTSGADFATTYLTVDRELFGEAVNADAFIVSPSYNAPHLSVEIHRISDWVWSVKVGVKGEPPIGEVADNKLPIEFQLKQEHKIAAKCHLDVTLRPIR